ncbi:MAG: beta-N-acetylglucosaminidase [Saprospiraceae bacterium]|nr:MAG: beta-N-acetylglucosaminidase [Saprospiraceae bacterium]
MAVLSFCLLAVSIFAQQEKQAQVWVDSVYNSLSEDERLGQLFMIRAHSDKGASHIAEVEALIRDYHVGSLCFFQGTPEKQAELSNQYQALSKIPLLVAIDAEWGLGMRMKQTTISFPRQLMLGAIQNNDLIYKMGKEIGRELRTVGVQVNFAPVVDVNNNAANPVINTRSFGEDRYNVAVKSYMYMKGMQDEDVLACAKHFPGHGDTDVDSHLDLPVIKHDRNRLDSIELYPFRVLAQHDVGSMMVAHLNVPALDDRENRPTTLSRNTVTNLLRNELKFEGLIFTDALEMKGVTKHFKSGEVEAEALLAGNDVLVLPEDLGAAMQEIKRYLADGKLAPDQVEASVKRILYNKYKLGLNRYKAVPLENIAQKVNTNEAKALKQELIENALTLVRNEDNLLPFGKLDTLSMASLSIGTKSKTDFQKRLESYVTIPQLQTEKEISADRQKYLFNQFKEKDVVIVGLHDMNNTAKDQFGLTNSTISFLKTLNQKTKVVLVVFGNPYSLRYFDELDWVLEAYDDADMVQSAAAQALFGAIAVSGRLPVTASPKATFNTGISTRKNFRMGYVIPERMGLCSDSLNQLADIAREAINGKATPGCVVLVAKGGRIVYEGAFGHHTYAKKQPVATTDVYDLASITKIAATTLSIMKLQEAGLVDIEKPLGDYLPELRGTNKEQMIIKDLMAHRAGLEGWIPFYKQTVSGTRRNPRPSSTYYRKEATTKYSVPVTNHLFMNQAFIDNMWEQIIHSELRATREYKYSDLGFYLLARLIERVSDLPIDQYAATHFYQPLGLRTATYNPWQDQDIKHIVPTEEDRYWRRQRVQGYVHDMGAAMLGGVSGHAGLFADAQDLAILMQLLLWEGQYGGEQYLNPATIHNFTTRYEGDTRRGIGFDMLELNPNRKRNLSKDASPQTFGHLGFTGTCVWVDPEHDLVFVFLSNRTYPSMRNYKLNSLNIRPRMQTVVYNAMK